MPKYTVSSRKCVSGELDFSSKPRSLRRCMSGEMTAVPPTAENVELMGREEKKTVEKGHGSTKRTGVTMAEKLQGGRDCHAKRRPTASIAWDSLNRSRESSPQHELAAIPFKWEEAPGKPKEEAPCNAQTIAEAAERAMARRILQGVERSHRREVLLQKRVAAQVAAESLCDQVEASAEIKKPQEFQTLGENSLHRSLKSSRRFYARTSSAGPRSSTFQGLRLNVEDGSHVISEVETEAHIDLVAPAAAKFLVESCISPHGTPEQNLTRIPFKWEEAPGKPKFDDATDTMPKKLQLPPRLVAPPTQNVDSISRDLQCRYRERSKSGPLLGYYPPILSSHTSPARTRPQQQSHPVLRSSSPSKRSISPSKIQALAKQLSFKVSKTDSATNQGSCKDEQYQQTRTPSPSKRSISPSKMQAFAMHLSRKVSGANTATQESSCEDQMWTHRNSSPLKRSISPSKIHTLAKHFSQKVLNTAECNPYEDTSQQPRNLEHSTASRYHSGPLEGYLTRTKGGGYGNLSFERNFLGAPSLLINREQDYSWPAEHEKASRHWSGIIGYDSRAIESSTTSSKWLIAPSLQSFSPSRIPSLAKQLTRKVMPPQEIASKGPNWPMQAKGLRHSFPTSYDSSPLERYTDKAKCGSTFSLERRSENISSEEWLDKHPQGLQDPWSPTSIFHGPNGNSHVPSNSVPSSGSDIESHTHMTTPPSITHSRSQSNTLNESFEQCHEEHHSPTSSHPTHCDADVSPVGSPYLGPTSADYVAQESGGRAGSEGVKAIIKLCRAGSTRRKSRNQHSPEIWAPTLATYFQCVEQSATTSGQLNTQDVLSGNLPSKDNKTEDMDSEGSSPLESPEVATRLPYTMPSVMEQEMAGREQFDSSSTDYPSTVAVKLSRAISISRGENQPYNHTLTRADTIPVASAPEHNSEDGYKSPVYTATLELLSPSTELISKKKVLGKLKSITMRLASAKMDKRTQFIELMCKSLKQALHNCARQCCHSTKLQLREDNQFPPTEFSFCKPN
ncbi:hypothetical protein CY35_05G075400 [Sphagnum magellanicum]|nr:hypothetical protein CY35_05G075400 [Sphagnum magellanicum]